MIPSVERTGCWSSRALNVVFCPQKGQRQAALVMLYWLSHGDLGDAGVLTPPAPRYPVPTAGSAGAAHAQPRAPWEPPVLHLRELPHR